VRAGLRAARDRWDGMSRSAQGALGVLLASAFVFVIYRLPGIGTVLEDKAPFGIVVAGVIVGKALYEGRFTVEEALAACRP